MSFRKVTSLEINGAPWEVGFGYPGKKAGRVHDGLCSWERKRITIQRKAKGRKRTLLGVIAHEVCHAVFPSADEQYVEHLAQSIEEAYLAMLEEENG